MGLGWVLFVDRSDILHEFSNDHDLEALMV
jgi:hypothetical protein